MILTVLTPNTLRNSGNCRSAENLFFHFCGSLVIVGDPSNIHLLYNNSRM